jgi:hypothetical protein
MDRVRHVGIGKTKSNNRIYPGDDCKSQPLTDIRMYIRNDLFFGNVRQMNSDAGGSGIFQVAKYKRLYLMNGLVLFTQPRFIVMPREDYPPLQRT